MRTNSKKDRKPQSIIEKQFKRIPVKKLSKQSGFCKRKPRKIQAKKLITALLLSLWSSKRNTYSDWASKLSQLIGDTVSKQAIAKRITEEFVNFLEDMLKALMKKSLSEETREKLSFSLNKFKRILLEDSTTIPLDKKMNKEYPGSKNQMGEEYATMKIQTVYELKGRNFLNFEVTNFRKNDQGYSSRILQIVKPGDLLLRDLGYFVLGVFKKLTERGVSFVSRFRQGVNIYKKEDEPIDLAKMLKRRGELDMEVFLGEKERTPVRFIAIPVDEEVSNERRRKAKKRRDHGRQFNKRYLYLLGWNLLITNIPTSEIDSHQIAKIYSIRWRIETIFKSWKSCLGIKNIPRDSNKIRLKSFIYCMLIFILMFQVHYYIYYSRFKKKSDGIGISLIKLMQYITDNIFNIIFLFHKSILERQIIYYCSYEKRGDRLNYNQVLCLLS